MYCTPSYAQNTPLFHTYTLEKNVKNTYRYVKIEYTATQPRASLNPQNFSDNAFDSKSFGGNFVYIIKKRLAQ